VTGCTVAVDVAAEQDLADIVDYIAGQDSVERAIAVGTRIDRAIASLPRFPNRGSFPKELLDQGNREFREVHFKPYRIIYRVLADKVVVLLIADGRRDMRALLARRLLGA
jgi:toxin ParE1/3/4